MVDRSVEAAAEWEVEAMERGAAAMALVLTERDQAVAEQAVGGKGCRRAPGERAAEMVVVVVLTAAEVEGMGQAAVAMVLAVEEVEGRAVAMGWGAGEMGQERVATVLAVEERVVEAAAEWEVEAMGRGAAAVARVVMEREKAVAEQAVGGEGCGRAPG